MLSIMTRQVSPRTKLIKETCDIRVEIKTNATILAIAICSTLKREETIADDPLLVGDLKICIKNKMKSAITSAYEDHAKTIRHKNII